MIDNKTNNKLKKINKKRHAKIACSLLSTLCLTSALVNHANALPVGWYKPSVGMLVGGAIPSFDNKWNSAVSGAAISHNAVNDLEDEGPFMGLRAGVNYNTGYNVNNYGDLFTGLNIDASYSFIRNSTYYYAADGQVTASERAGLNISAISTIRGLIGLELGDYRAFASGGVGFVEAEFTSSTSDTDFDHGKLSISQTAPVLGLGAAMDVSKDVTLAINALYHIIDDSKFVGSLGDGNTTDSRIKFKGLTTVDLSLSYNF